MYFQAFISTFLPTAPIRSFPDLPSYTSGHVLVGNTCCSLRPDKNYGRSASPMPLVAAGLAALSLLFSKAPARAYPASTPSAQFCSDNATNSTCNASSVPSAILFKPRVPPHQADESPFLIVPNHDSLEMPSEGSLLRVEPSPIDDASAPGALSGAADAPFRSPTPSPRSNSAANYPQNPSAAGTLPEWAAAGVHRAVRTPDRLIKLRPRVRPATLGLVGVGAFTSGSVFLRSLTQKGIVPSGDAAVSANSITVDKPTGFFSVVCMHIPFCVPERTKLLDGLTELADTACLVTAEGMATAVRNAAALLLEESGLLEDSTKFAPHVDVFLADSMVSAERRFSGHVVIEEHRIERISGKTVGYDVSPRARLGQYGVVTLVVATTEGVDLDCYDDGTTVIKRLRAALHSTCRLKTGDVAGMELRWAPETRECRSLTRAQLSDAYPFLRVL